MRKQFGIVAAVALSVAFWAVPAGLTMTADSRIWVEGTSTVRSYECKATRVEGRVETAGPLGALEDAVPVVETVSVVVDVDAIDCDNGTMNGHMKKALKQETHPTLSYTARAVGATPVDGAVRITLAGDLTMAGETRPLQVEGDAVRGEGGEIRFQGTVGFDMTEWGVKPPSLMLGTLKVHKQVKVGFDVVLVEGSG